MQMQTIIIITSTNEPIELLLNIFLNAQKCHNTRFILHVFFSPERFCNYGGADGGRMLITLHIDCDSSKWSSYILLTSKLTSYQSLLVPRCIVCHAKIAQFLNTLRRKVKTVFWIHNYRTTCQCGLTKASSCGTWVFKLSQRVCEHITRFNMVQMSFTNWNFRDFDEQQLQYGQAQRNSWSSVESQYQECSGKCSKPLYTVSGSLFVSFTKLNQAEMMCISLVFAQINWPALRWKVIMASLINVTELYL